MSSDEKRFDDRVQERLRYGLFKRKLLFKVTEAVLDFSFSFLLIYFFEITLVYN